MQVVGSGAAAGWARAEWNTGDPKDTSPSTKRWQKTCIATRELKDGEVSIPVRLERGRGASVYFDKYLYFTVSVAFKPKEIIANQHTQRANPSCSPFSPQEAADGYPWTVSKKPRVLGPLCPYATLYALLSRHLQLCLHFTSAESDCYAGSAVPKRLQDSNTEGERPSFQLSESHGVSRGRLHNSQFLISRVAHVRNSTRMAKHGIRRKRAVFPRQIRAHFEHRSVRRLCLTANPLPK